MAAKIGFGTALSYSTDGGTTYVPLAGIKSITPPKKKIGDVPIETMDSATVNGNPATDFIPGWVDVGEVDAKIVFNKTTYSTLTGLVGTAGTHFKIIKSDGSGYAFVGYINELGDPTPLKTEMEADVKIKVTGGACVFSTAQS